MRFDRMPRRQFLQVVPTVAAATRPGTGNISDGGQQVKKIVTTFLTRGISSEVEETLQRLIPKLRVVEMLDNIHADRFFGSFAYRQEASRIVSNLCSHLPREQIPALFQAQVASCLDTCAFYLPEDSSQFATDQGIKGWASKYIDKKDIGSWDLEVRQAFDHIMNLKGHLLRKEITLDKLKNALLGAHIDLKGQVYPSSLTVETDEIEGMQARLKELQTNPTLSQFLEALSGFDGKSAFIKAIRCLDSGMVDVGTFMSQFRDNEIATIVDVVKTNGRRIRQAYADMQLVRAGKPVSETDLHADVQSINRDSANPNNSYPSIYNSGVDSNGSLYQPRTLHAPNTYSGNIARARWERR